MTVGENPYNPFGTDDDPDEPDEGGSGDAGESNKSFKELRKAYNRLERQAKASEKELEELRGFKTSVVEKERDQAVTQAFKDLELNPAHAKLYKALNPEVAPEDVSKEAVAKFAVEYGLATNSGETVEAPEPKPEGFKPVTTGIAPQTTMLTSEDVDKMMALGDIEGVRRAFESGRIQKEEVPWTVQEA